MIQPIYKSHIFNLTAPQCELVDAATSTERALGRPEILLQIKELFGGSGPCRLPALPAV